MSCVDGMRGDEKGVRARSEFKGDEKRGEKSLSLLMMARTTLTLFQSTDPCIPRYFPSLSLPPSRMEQASKKSSMIGTDSSYNRTRNPPTQYVKLPLDFRVDTAIRKLTFRA